MQEAKNGDRGKILFIAALRRDLLYFSGFSQGAFFYIRGPSLVELTGHDNSATLAATVQIHIVDHNADLSIDVDRRIRNAWCSFRKYILELHDRPSAPLELKIRMVRAEVLKTILYGCVPWSPCAYHYDTLRRAHHRFLTLCIGWRKHSRAKHPISYLDTLIKTLSASIGATLRRKRILFAEFVARMEDTRLLECLIFGELVGGTGCEGGQEKDWMGYFPVDLRAYGISADLWTITAP